MQTSWPKLPVEEWQPTRDTVHSYAYPEPAGFRAADSGLSDAYFDQQLGEHVLPYAAVRAASDPDEYLREFLESTFLAARDLGGWPAGLPLPS